MSQGFYEYLSRHFFFLFCLLGGGGVWMSHSFYEYNGYHLQIILFCVKLFEDIYKYKYMQVFILFCCVIIIFLRLYRSTTVDQKCVLRDMFTLSLLTGHVGFSGIQLALWGRGF